jgi:hypothetical protein
VHTITVCYRLDQTMLLLDFMVVCSSIRTLWNTSTSKYIAVKISMLCKLKSPRVALLPYSLYVNNSFLFVVSFTQTMHGHVRGCKSWPSVENVRHLSISPEASHVTDATTIRFHHIRAKSQNQEFSFFGWLLPQKTQGAHYQCIQICDVA